MHLVISMRYRTSITWNAVRHKLVVGYRIVKLSISPIFQVSSSSPLAAPKGRYTNTSLSQTTKAYLRNLGAPGTLNSRRDFKPIIFLELGHDWRTVCLNCGLFSDKLFRVWKPELPSTVFPITVMHRIPTFRSTADRM
jgi:hypothetical protein